jgi:hypothetical protein
MMGGYETEEMRKKDYDRRTGMARIRGGSSK